MLASRLVPNHSDGRPVETFPATPAQQGMLFHHLLDDRSGTEVQQLICRLVEPHDGARLEAAWHGLAARHSALRTAFRWDATEPLQEIYSEAVVPLERRPGGDEELSAHLAHDRRRGFDLPTPPLTRVTMFERNGMVETMVWSYHQALLDTRSAWLLLEELFALYDTAGDGMEPLALSPPFSAFVEWLSRRDASGDRAFWRKYLAGFTAPTPLLSLPVDDGGERYDELTIELPDRTGVSLRELTLRLGVSSSTPILAAWALLLSRYNGERDMVFGVAESRRSGTIPDADRVVGNFLNTVPLRVDVPLEATSASRWIAQVDESVASTRPHEHAPLVKIQTWSDIPRGAPLFESVVIVEEELPGAAVAARAKVDLVERTEYPLTLTTYPDRLKLTWSRARLDDGTIRRMAGHLLTVLEAFATDEDVSRLTILTEAERREVLTEWNATRRDCAQRRVDELFGEQARQHPERVALSAASERLTYAELDRRSGELAAELRSRGVTRETLVAILLDRSFEMVVALLGILKAGGAYVPLDPTYPRERLEFMLDDSCAAVLVTERKYENLVTANHATRLVLDDSSPERPASSPPGQADLPTLEDLAYVLYTSGSTGKPKGVQVPHRALANFLHSMAEEPGFREFDVILALTTLSFDIAGLEIWLPLVTGARIELVPREIASDARKLAELIEASGATVVQATPATWRMLIDAGWRGNERLKILCGGEAMPSDLAEQLLTRCGSLWNMYGPTETTIWSTVKRVEAVDSSAVPIGRPIANTEVYVLDRNLEPVPIGVAGELHIGGAGVARGYLNRPELTEERFIVDPFANDRHVIPNEGGRAARVRDLGSGLPRMYKTGDSARWLPTGELEYLGRLDDQVKLRGYRIELGEIESAMRKHPSIGDVAVALRSDAPGGKALAAYFTSQDATSASELRGFLKEQLPEYMVPSYFVPLEALPLTPNGKVNRRALPPPERTAPESREATVLPRDPIEQQLAKIWCDILRLQSVGIHDNFFELGGESLLAVQMFVRVEREFDRELPLATLFRAPTIASLAERLREEGWEAPWSPLIPIQPAGTKPPFFCIHGVGGNVLNYRNLALRLGLDQPFYGLQARGLDGKASPVETIEEMASLYLREIATLQPHGPYSIGGASFGGVVAYEMARQLRARGESLRIVALFDTDPVNYSRFAPTEDDVRPNLAGRMKVHLTVLLRGPDRLGYFRKKARRVWRRTVYRSWQTTAKLFQKVSKPLPTALQNVQQTNYLALRRYMPERYAGEVVLFCATGEPDEFRAMKQRGWQILTDRVEIRDVPGDHLTMVDEPHVAVLAAQLSDALSHRQ